MDELKECLAKVLSEKDKMNLKFLFKVSVPEGIEVPKTLEALSEFKLKIYSDYIEKINEGLLAEQEIKSIFNDLLPSALEIEARLMYIKSEIEKQYSKCHMSGSGTTLYVIGKKELILDNIEYVYLNKHLIKNTVND